MIPLKIGRKRYWLPQTYAEIPVYKIPKLPELQHDPNAFVSFLIDAPAGPDASSIVPFLSFLGEKIDLSGFAASTDPKIPDIKTCTWGQKIQAHVELQKQTPIESMPIVVGLYMTDKTSEEWGRCTLGELYPIFLNLVTQLNEVVKLEENRLKSEPSREQQMAGIHKFKELGYMNQIDMIAGGDVTKYEAVLAIDYNTIFAKLLKIKISDTFAEEYRRIITPKKP